MGDQYCLIGPYKESSARTEFEEFDFPSHNPFYEAVRQYREKGFQIHTGRWLVDGNPQVILVDIGSGAWMLDGFKNELWESSHIGIPHGDAESNDALLFGYLVATFLELFQASVKTYSEENEMGVPRIVAHFHEWQAGLGLVALRTRHVPIATVFTTHATLLGR